jgi:integrase
MKQARSGHRGVYWRANPRGSQRLPGGARGDWWARWACGCGKLHREKIGAKALSREESERRRTRARLEGWCPNRERARRVTVETLLKFVETDYRVNGKRSLRTMLCAQKPLLRHFGAGRLATDVGAGDLKAYRDARLEAKVQPATVNRELSCLRRGFNLARRDGLLDLVPVFPMLGEDNVRTGFFEEHEREALFAALPEPFRPLARFLSLTGWRLGEALLLTWAQVDDKATVIRLEPGTTKNSDGRTFPYGKLPELAALLAERRAATLALNRDQGRIIPLVFHVDGERIWPKRFYRHWWQAANAAEVYHERKDPLTGKIKRGPIPHDFRRTVVRNLERAGVARSVAMKLTGHKTEAVYRRYAIVSEADLAEGVERLAALPPSRTLISTLDRRAAAAVR